MGNVQKNLVRKAVVNDSLMDVGGQTISGGMGERVSGESTSRFADDENGRLQKSNQEAKKCLRCNSFMLTNARYCRKCYKVNKILWSEKLSFCKCSTCSNDKERRTWMPEKPNRKRRIVHRESNSNMLSSDSEMLFVPGRNSLMKGDVRTPNPQYSNLPNRSTVERVSSSDSGFDYEKERKIARLERREYIKELQEIHNMMTDSSDRSSQSTDPEDEIYPCNECGERIQNTFIVHNKIAHYPICDGCAKKLRQNGNKCPQCGENIECTIRFNKY